LSLKPSNAFFFYGLNLETEKKGIIYHALGVNSSSYKDYVYSGTLWLEQSAMLNPYIVVISLGTNDAQDYNMTEEVFQKQVIDLILSVRKYIPNAAILLTTPPSSYFRKLNPNPMLPMINEVIKEVAINHNCAYWDLFEIMGGADSIKEWVEKEWARPDYVHLSIQGYEWIGTKFYEAIMKSYESSTGN
jgi:lysophospholipase L1-like esterase